MREACQLKYSSVLTDLSNMSLPRQAQEGVACAQRHTRLPPGVMESGNYFVTALFQIAQQLVAMSDREGVSALHSFSSEVSLVTFDLLLVTCMSCRISRHG